MDPVNKYRASKKSVFAALGIFALSAVALLTAIILKFALVQKIRTEHTLASYLILSVVTFTILLSYFFYVMHSRVQLVQNARLLAVTYFSMTVTVIACLYLEIVSVFLMPVMLTAFLLAPLTLGRDAFVSNVFANLLIFFVLATQNYLGDNTDYYKIITMFAMGVIGGTATAYWVSSDARRLQYVMKGLLVAVIGVMAAFTIVVGFGGDGLIRTLGFLSLGTIGQVLLASIMQPINEALFNLLTNTRLAELTDHKMPLVKRLIEEAPGTFNHSLAVANFAEMCATAIGENPYLARACAYYHDVGKLVNPQFFKENQPTGENPHDGLLPEVSAEIIRSHTVEGKRLCDEYRIPHEISDITIEHHGTLPIYVFLNKAKQLTDAAVEKNAYCYYGRTPVSKLAAIIMLCDSSEAAIRAMDNPDPERVDALLRKLIADRIGDGQFDDCDISLRDLDTIRQTIINGFGGQFHKRLRYPDGGDR
ncbi:MAG: HDIG domain-containing protein [Clostridiales bacterium]|nr:HDIG domain-containing protein [Clostridiales bacterium]